MSIDYAKPIEVVHDNDDGTCSRFSAQFIGMRPKKFQPSSYEWVIAWGNTCAGCTYDGADENGNLQNKGYLWSVRNVAEPVTEPPPLDFAKPIRVKSTGMVAVHAWDRSAYDPEFPVGMDMGDADVDAWARCMVENVPDEPVLVRNLRPRRLRCLHLDL